VRDPEPESVALKESLDLLARAALAPEAEAIAAWRAWRAAYDIDTTPWNEVRMLGAVASRIAMLEPDAAIRPRVLGIRKFLWVHSQMCLKNAITGLAALNGTAIPVLLMKGAARIARKPSSAQERLIRDVDALVPLGQRQQAFDVLQDDGWTLVPDDWQINAHRWAPVAGHHAWSLSKGKSEIDLHHFSNHLNRLRGDDDGLWSRSVPAQLLGALVRVPSPADALLIAVVHGVRWSLDAAADWTVDASALLDEGEVDWTVCLKEAADRQLQSVLLAGFLYLRDTLRKPVPDDVIDQLRAQSTPEQLAELEQYTSLASPETPKQIFAARTMASERALGGRSVKPSSDASHNGSFKFTGLLPLGKPCTFKPPPCEGPPGWLKIRVELDWSKSNVSEDIMVDFVAPGLQLAKHAGVLRAHSAQSFTITLPEILLEARNIEELMFAVRTANVQTDVPFTLTLTRSNTPFQANTR
jgi:hypothetical protein